jgi:signal transduction histidine kinase
MESDDSKYMLETEIIDTGIGISEDRQKMLFIPFLELKLK